MHRLFAILLFTLITVDAQAKRHLVVLPGVPMRPGDIKPYLPPKLDPEPPLEPTEVKTVEVTSAEAVIEMRPWPSPMVGNAIGGARLPVRGVVKATRGCSGKVWYAVEPFGYLCSREAKPTTEAPTTTPVIEALPHSRLPFRYVMVFVKDEEKLPMWTTVAALGNGDEPERQLKKGDTVAIQKSFEYEGERYWISVEGKVLPAKHTGMMGTGSEWHGVDLDDKVALPLGWVTPESTKAYATPPAGKPGPATEHLERRTRLSILDEKIVGKTRWLKVVVIAPAPPRSVGAIMEEGAKKKEPPTPTPTPTAASELWVDAAQINEARKLDRPATVPAEVEQWIDVDLGEQVLVAYEKDTPVFATLVSSGRAIPTPMGTYPVWAKVSAITMKNQPYEDKPYFVNKVPWSTFFQWHNAIHGAYWHDRFGISKSHGCVNVAPLDARHIFEWVKPPLPPGWTGLRPLELMKSPTVVVRNSHAKKMFRQDRPVGPPDRTLEADRLEEAEKRRAEEAAKATPATQTTSAPAPPGPASPTPH